MSDSDPNRMRRLLTIKGAQRFTRRGPPSTMVPVGAYSRSTSTRGGPVFANRRLPSSLSRIRTPKSLRQQERRRS